jgi:hypothetical protein
MLELLVRYEGEWRERWESVGVVKTLSEAITKLADINHEHSVIDARVNDVEVIDE